MKTSTVKNMFIAYAFSVGYSKDEGKGFFADRHIKGTRGNEEWLTFISSIEAL